jgi:hypothetical protein
MLLGLISSGVDLFFVFLSFLAAKGDLGTEGKGRVQFIYLVLILS